jgi:hypothetical protein
MEMKKTVGYPLGEGAWINALSETQVIIQNGADTQLRVTLNNGSNGLVEVEFQEMHETPFHYPLQRR